MERWEGTTTLRPVAIIVPVLGRPQRVEPLLASIAAATPGAHSVLFVADDDDTIELGELARCGASWITSEPGACYARKVNLGIAATAEPVIFQAADDLHFHAGWNERAQARYANRRIHVVGTNDLYNPRVVHGRHSTHSMVSRAYIEQHGTIDEPGKLMHEGYGHCYCDDEMVQTARFRRAYATARDSIVEHLHPYAAKADEDWVYARGRSFDEQGRRVYEQRRRLWTSGL